MKNDVQLRHAAKKFVERWTFLSGSEKGEDQQFWNALLGNCEGGWGYNSEHTNLAGFLTDFAKTNEFTDAELIASPIFRKFDNPIFHQANLVSIAQTELNKVMGDGIPATSFAAGRNPIGSTISEDYNYQSGSRPNGWPRREN